MLERYEEVIERKIRPQLLNHNGDIELVSFENGVLKIKFLGHCQGCPSAQITLENIIEGELKTSFPEIEKVVISNDISDELYEIAKKILRKENV